MQGAIPAARQCGDTRCQGAVYFECAVTHIPGAGSALHRFLIDPPANMSGADLSPIGTQLWQDQQTGVWHILDLIGQDNYPNVADWLEETRRFGVSRKLSPSLDYSKLSADSKIIVGHRRGWINNHWEYAIPAGADLATCCGRQHATYNDHYACPLHMYNKNNKIHLLSDEMFQTDSCCAGVWWEDLGNHASHGKHANQPTWEPFNPDSDELALKEYLAMNELTPQYSAMHPVKLYGEDDQWHQRLVKRRMSAGSRNEYVYFAHRRPDHIIVNTEETFNKRYETAMIGRFRMSRLAVVKGVGADGTASSDTVSRLSDLGLPVEEVDE